jgi:hypothetical protein
MGPIACPETSVTNYQRCVTSQKSEDIMYTAAEVYDQRLLWLVIRERLTKSLVSLPNYILSRSEDQSLDVVSCADTCHMLIWRSKRRDMHLWRHAVVRSRNICTSSAILTAWYDFTGTAPLLGALMSRPTIKVTQVFMWSAPIFCPIISKSEFSRQILQKRYEYQYKYICIKYIRKKTFN